MKAWLQQLFSEQGDVSLLRVMALIVCITACYIAIAKGDTEVAVVSVLLGTAFGGKVAQKALEVRDGGHVDKQ